ncbi:MAG: hypothetical protein QOE64_605 [Frankiales bacterium]|nr:hypothetical protein [Frankiales bacterium]
MASRSVDRDLLVAWAPSAPSGGGKEERGRVLVIGGDVGTPGGVLLAGEAALRVGAGKLQIGCAPEAVAALAVAVPEALVVDRAEVSALAAEADAVLIGPGIGDADEASRIVKGLLPELENVPLVLDALALAAADLVTGRAAPTVLTPNPTEAARALDRDELGDEVAAAVELSSRTGAVVALGSELSVCAGPGGPVWTDNSGDSGLGVSGSGDVKAGAVAGLLARGLAPERAAVLATWLHARAGERCGPIGYLAREIAAELPHALAELSGADGRDTATQG